MHNPFDHFGAFLGSVWDHAFTLAAGCVVTVVIALIEKHFMKGKKLPLKADVGILLLFVFFACFQAWHDQYEIAIHTNSPPTVQVNVPPINVPPAQVTVEPNREKSAPKLSGVIDVIMLGDIPHQNAAEIFLLIGVRNQGTAPSIAQGWTLILTSPTVNVRRQPSFIANDFKLLDEKGNAILQIPTGSHIEDKTITPIPQGAYVRGWLRFIIPNVTAEQIKATKKSLIFYDVNDTVCHTDFSHATDKEPPLYFPGVSK